MDMRCRITSGGADPAQAGDRKSTRLNSSHDQISYAVFCLKKKNSRSGISTSPSDNSLIDATREDAAIILTILFPFKVRYSLLDFDVKNAQRSAFEAPSVKHLLTTSS